MHPVLLIDDDADLGELLREYMAGFSIDVCQAVTPSAGLAQLKRQEFQAIVLDVMLPEMNGFDVCREIRRTSDIPIIMLSARGDVTDRVVGLEIGADDYLPKPFEPRELVARVLANIKRPARTRRDSENESFGRLVIARLRREATVDGQPVNLTTMEFELLTLLSAEPGRVMSRDDIIAALKGTEQELFTRSVDILVSRLRAKLKPLDVIRTSHGVGYVFVGSDDEATA